MNEETNKDLPTLSTIAPAEQEVPQKKNWIFWVLAASFLIGGTVITSTYFFQKNNKNPQAPKQQFTNQPGSPVDHATYRVLQNLMLKTSLANPEVIENSLRLYDIDGDGDEDVLGLIQLTFSYGSDYRFTTWHRDDESYVYDTGGYNDFSFTEGTSCLFSNLALKSVTLTCTESGREYSITLHYQPTDVGYYRDVDAHVVTFNGGAGWNEYDSKKAGIQFSYPSDVSVTEKTYDIYGELITVVTAMRSDKTLFEIHSVPFQGEGGGTIDNAWKGIFIKLAYGSYLSRDLMIPGSEKSGVFYRKTNVHEDNNSGSLFNSYEIINNEQNRRYTLFTALATETDLKEIDNIFSSIKYVQTPAARDAETILIQDNTTSFASAATLTIPGHVSDRPAPTDTVNTLALRDIEITFIDSPVYQPASLKLELHPFDSIGDAGVYGGGGYDAEKNGCFGFDKNIITAPRKIGENQVCKFQAGDAGISVKGYHILSPNRKYILSITEKRENPDQHTLMLSPDLETIVESVRFSTQ